MASNLSAKDKEKKAP